MSKYQQPAILGVIGLVLISSPLFIKIPVGWLKFNLQTDAEIEQFRLQQKKETAQKINELGIIPSYNSLKIRGYIDTPKHNPKPDLTGYSKDEIVIVYDSTGICIGKIQNQKWLWKYRYKNVCELTENDS